MRYSVVATNKETNEETLVATRGTRAQAEYVLANDSRDFDPDRWQFDIRPDAPQHRGAIQVELPEHYTERFPGFSGYDAETKARVATDAHQMAEDLSTDEAIDAKLAVLRDLMIIERDRKGLTTEADPEHHFFMKNLSVDIVIRTEARDEPIRASIYREDGYYFWKAEGSVTGRFGTFYEAYIGLFTQRYFPVID